MSSEILINMTPNESRVALVENGVLQEVYIERTAKRGLVGNVYKGKVSRVLPGMQAAFIDVGLERAAFLHASDIKIDSDDNNETNKVESINSLVTEGQEICVQVVKDPLGTKGARLTTQVSIPSRFLVFMAGVEHIGISQKIEAAEERDRLRAKLEELAVDDYAGGYIVRTAAEGISDDEIQADVEYLHRMWTAIIDKMKTEKAPNIIHEDLPLAMRMMRDLVSPEIEKIRIDSKETFERAAKFGRKFIPEVAERIEYYPGERPIFDLYSVEDEIHKALGKRADLKSGGYLIIDQTEAMTTIDVNTGGFVGHRNLDETIFKTNLEAGVSIARQLRLRNLGGIIIIDFIDMQDEEHKRQVLRSLEKNLEKDHAKCHISQVSALGLVEMTRKRTRESLEHILCEDCPTCNGRGSLRTAETVCYEIFREIIREARQYEAQTFLVLASQAVVDRLLDEESTSVAELEDFIGKPIKLQVESLYTQEHYDVVLM